MSNNCVEDCTTEWDTYNAKQELDSMKLIWKNMNIHHDCNKHMRYYQHRMGCLSDYLNKKIDWKNDSELIGSFNEKTKEIIKRWGLNDGQYLLICIDFEKGGFHIGDIA